MRRAELAGAAHMELVSGVVQLRPEDAMVEAMLRGWCAQQTARGLKEDTIVRRRVSRFLSEHAGQGYEAVSLHGGEATIRSGTSA